MIYKYNLSISGDNFYPETILTKIKGDFIVNSSFNPIDKRMGNNEYGYGNMSFWHPLKFSTEDEISKYEKDFIEFIEKNHQLFIENNVSDLQIFIEIYFDGGQCNFEIFNKILLGKLAVFGVSIPVSVYLLNEQDCGEWENEIKQEWKIGK